MLDSNPRHLQRLLALPLVTNGPKVRVLAERLGLEPRDRITTTDTFPGCSNTIMGPLQILYLCKIFDDRHHTLQNNETFGRDTGVRTQNTRVRILYDSHFTISQLFGGPCWIRTNYLWVNSSPHIHMCLWPMNKAGFILDWTWTSISTPLRRGVLTN